jgi:hypothetical protein
MFEVSMARGVYLLKQQIPGKGFEHYAVGITGVIDPALGIYGSPVVVHRMPEGIHLTRWFESGPWVVLDKASEAKAALKRLVHACQDPNYRLLDNNCEQFAREIVSGKRESRQVQGVMVALIGVGVLALASRS